MARGYFITCTDTEVGKTWCTVGLMAALQQQGKTVVAIKPVASGCERTAEGLRNDDALRLQAQASIELPYEDVNTPMPSNRRSLRTWLQHKTGSPSASTPLPMPSSGCRG